MIQKSDNYNIDYCYVLVSVHIFRYKHANMSIYVSSHSLYACVSIFNVGRCDAISSFVSGCIYLGAIMYIHVGVSMFVYLPKPLHHKQSVTQVQSFSKVLLTLKSTFRVFFLLDCLSKQSKRILLIIQSWMENSWIYTFLKRISTMQNSLIQNLNADCQTHLAGIIKYTNCISGEV